MSRGDHIKLVDEQEPPQQPTYPHTNIQFGPSGFAVQIFLADDVILTKVFDERTANEICKRWLETRQQVKQQLEMVQRTKENKL